MAKEKLSLEEVQNKLVELCNDKTQIESKEITKYCFQVTYFNFN